MSIEEVQATLGISRRTIRSYVAEGRLPARRVGPRLLRFYRGDVMQLLQPADSVKVKVGR